MNLRRAFVLLGVGLAGCGYPGEPRPPALNRPVPVADLSVVQHGDRILVHFTVSTTTTEDLPLKNPAEIELRVGPPPAGRFDLDVWERDSSRIPATSGNAEIDARPFIGKTEVIGVRLHGPHGHDAGWSKLERLTVVPPLPMPEALAAHDAQDAVRLEWHAAAPQFRIFRKQPAEADWKQLGLADQPFYLDKDIDYGKTYQYQVQAVEKSGDEFAESAVSAPLSFRPRDLFPPAVPAGITAVPGTRSIELVWERNQERDFSAYRVYRDGKRITDGLTAPSYSDKDVKPGTKYSYQVSAIDAAGNESKLSAPVESLIP